MSDAVAPTPLPTEQERMQNLAEMHGIPKDGPLARGLQKYHGVTMMDTMRLMSVINSQQTVQISAQVDAINAELDAKMRAHRNPANPEEFIYKPITPAEELMLREDRGRLLTIQIQQHNQKLKEVALEMQAAKMGQGEGKKKRKPGFSPMEIEGGGE